VTLSPRFLIINHIDPLLAAAFRKKGEGKSDSLFSNVSPLDDVGIYVLQVCQASQHISALQSVAYEGVKGLSSERDEGLSDASCGLVSTPIIDALKSLQSIQLSTQESAALQGLGSSSRVAEFLPPLEKGYEIASPLRERLKLSKNAAKVAYMHLQ
jgi:hypothetical protein